MKPKILLLIALFCALHQAKAQNDFAADLAPPGQVQVLEQGLRKVILGWTPSMDSRVSGYAIYRRADDETEFYKIADVQGWQTARFNDKKKLEDQKVYFYTIVAIGQDGSSSPPSAAVKAQTKGKPKVVSGLEAQGGPRHVSLRWKASGELEIQSYRIWRASERDSEYSKIATIEGREETFFDDKKLADQTAYYYMVTSVNTVGLESDPCQPVMGKTFTPPNAPVGLRAQSNRVGQLILEWQPNPQPNLAFYNVLRSKKADKSYKVVGQAGPKETQYIDLSVHDGTLYYYSLVAVDLDGLSSQPAPPVRAFTQTPPLPPDSISASPSPDGQGVILKWKAYKDSKVKGYVVYKRKWFFWWEEIGRTSENRVLISGLKSKGSARFKVSSFQENGLESKKSETLKVKLGELLKQEPPLPQAPPPTPYPFPRQAEEGEREPLE